MKERIVSLKNCRPYTGCIIRFVDADKTFTLTRNIINLDLCGYKIIKLGEC